MTATKVLLILLGVLVMFGGMWTGAYLYNTLSEGYQFVSFCTGFASVMIGFVLSIFAIVEM